MPKKRLIFTLLYQQGGFYLSRNFRLQRVGDLNWLEKNYRFAHIASAIDELIILDVTRKGHVLSDFCSAANQVASNCFMPLALGGNIRTLTDAEALMSNGADKLVVNTTLYTDPEFVRQLVQIYGSQCIVASVDYRIENGSFVAYSHQGSSRIDYTFGSYIERLVELGVGELYLNSIDRDGTGQGFCLESLSQLGTYSSMPVILAGGAGNENHLLEGIVFPNVDAVATANLFNFIGNGLPASRSHLVKKGVNMARW